MRQALLLAAVGRDPAQVLAADVDDDVLRRRRLGEQREQEHGNRQGEAHARQDLKRRERSSVIVMRNNATLRWTLVAFFAGTLVFGSLRRATEDSSKEVTVLCLLYTSDAADE